MEIKYKENCPNCGAEIYYSDNEKLIKCTSCGKPLVVAEFVREQQKIEQQLAEGETAKAELAKAKQEKQKAQDALNETVRALDGIQTDQHVQRETLEQLLDIQYADKSLHDNMLLLLQTIQGEQQDENGFLNHLLHNIGAGQKTADEKLESIKNIVEQLLQNQNNTEKMISVLNEQLSASDQEKKKLIDEFIEWQNNVHKEDVERLKSIQNSSNSILNTLKKLDDEIDRTHTEISKVEDAVKGFESKWETDKRKKLIAKYKTAEKLQRERRFDEAQKYYQDVLINGGQDPEVYWRVLMCHYCIEYQRNDEGKEIPTILYPDLSDPNEVMERINLLEILDSTDRELREYYCTKLKAIDTTLDKYRRWQYKLQYDVFISVKQTDRANGKRHPTEDYKVGRDLYEYLTSLGLRVFNSECVTKLAGEEWEPYILAALMSARVMIVVGTCPEYMEAQWVKNEWTRYQWLQKFEKDTNKKRILFCYLSGGMSPEEIPKGLNPCKEAIVDGIGVQADLFTVLEGVFPQIKQEPIMRKENIENKSSAYDPSFDIVVAKMEAWLADTQYEKVVDTYNALIEEGQFLNEPKLYLYRLCADKRVGDFDELAEKKIVLQEERLFRLAIRKGTSQKDKELLDKLVKTNREIMGESDDNVSEAVFEKYDGNINGTDLPVDINSLQMQEVQNYDGNGQEQYCCGDYSYIVLDNGNAKITRYSGTTPHVEIPDKLNDHTVTIIGSSAFHYTESLFSIRIPDNVISIEESAFEECYHLSSIAFPKGLVSIGYYAFYCCTSLKSVDIPDGVNCVEGNPFSGCDELAYMNISPHHLHYEVVNNCLFSKADKKLICCLGSTNVEDFEIPEGTSSIGDNAFEYCWGIKRITIPSSVTQIGFYAFRYCTSLTQVLIHKGVSSVEDEAFSDCISLTHIVLPDSIKDIGCSPFKGCESLENINILSSNPYIEYTDGALISKQDHRLICYLSARKEEGYIIPEGIQEIGIYAFLNCKNIKNIQIPHSVIRIEGWAFCNCTALKRMFIPEGIKQIVGFVFYGCESLEIVALPESVEEIIDCAFDEVNKDLVIYAVKGSYAEQFCKEHNMKVISYTKV